MQGESSAVTGMAATASNEAQQCCVDFRHQNFIIFICCWWNDFTDSWYIMQYMEANKSRGKQLVGALSPVNHRGLQEPGMMTPMWLANSHSPVSAAQNQEQRCTLQDCQNVSCGRAYLSLATMIFLILFFIRFCGRAHVRTLQPI